MSAIQFKAKAYKPENAAKSNKDLLLLLPQSASDKLPSRGMALVEGTINGTSFKQPLEPNGEGSHLVVLDLKLQKETGIKAGDIAALSIEPSKDWPEPRIPADLKRALDSNKGAINTWKDITPMARWDWIRWINGTKKAETRQKRIDSLASRFRAGKRRPCCFNRSECTLRFE